MRTVQIPVSPGIRVLIGGGQLALKGPRWLAWSPSPVGGRILASISVAALGVVDLTHSLHMNHRNQLLIGHS